MSNRKKKGDTPNVRCAIYTRKSTEEGLDQEFNSLDAQRESGEAFIAAQRHEGWVCLPTHYDDGGFTGGNMDRPALRRLLADIEAGKIDCIVVYKVDRLSRSLLDFARMMETIDRHNVSFVSVTQQFNTGTSMGRLILNVLLSFAQFEREMISERTRDKIAAARRKGKWSGGMPLLGFDVVDTKLVVLSDEADRVQQIFELYLELGSLLATVKELNRRGWRTKRWTTKKGNLRGGRPFTKNGLYQLLTNVTYLGKVKYKDEVHDGEHEAIVDEELFGRVQATLGRNGRSGGSAVRNKYGALLKGLLRCKACDCAMGHTYSSKGQRRYRYYVCTRAQQRGWHECPAPSVPAGEIEQFVVDQIKCIGLAPEVIAATMDQARQEADKVTTRLERERADLALQIQSDEAEMQSLAGTAEPTSVQLGRLADAQERVRLAERRLTEVREELMALTKSAIDDNDVAAALADFAGVWDVLAPREQARILAILIERVDYDSRSGTISLTFHPTGITTLAGELAEQKEDAA